MSYQPEWVIYIGGTAERYFQVKSRNTSNALVAVDITGATFACKLRETVDSGTVIATATGSIVTASEGRMKAYIAPATTADLAAGSGVWDCWMTLGGEVRLIATGTYRIVQRVAR